MKILNKVLCLTIFFAIGSVSAKSVRKPAGGPVGKPAGGTVSKPGAPATTTASSSSSGKPAADKKPSAENQGKKSFKQLHNQVLGMNQNDVLTRYLLSNNFIQKMKDEISSFVLFMGENERTELEFLLKTARDKFLRFTGNDEKDLEILKNINLQIEKEVNNFK